MKVRCLASSHALSRASLPARQRRKLQADALSFPKPRPTRFRRTLTARVCFSVVRSASCRQLRLRARRATPCSTRVRSRPCAPPPRAPRPPRPPSSPLLSSDGSAYEPRAVAACASSCSSSLKAASLVPRSSLPLAAHSWRSPLCTSKPNTACTR